MNRLNRKIIAITVFFLISSLVYADFLHDLHFSASPYYKSFLGQQDEYVFIDMDFGRAHLSELEWQQFPLHIFGGELKTGWRNLYVWGGAEFALHTNTGIVKDSDWLNYGQIKNGVNVPAEYIGLKTNYSESPVELDSHYKLNINIGYTFNVAKKFSISPFASYDYEYSFYKAIGGFSQYVSDLFDSDYYKNEWFEAEKKEFENVKVLGLKRINYFTWIGAEFACSPTEKMNISLSVATSPFARVESLDYHYLTITNYYDFMIGIFRGFKGDFKFEYFFTKHHSLYADVSGLYTLVLYGDSYKRAIGSSSSWTRVDSVAGSLFKNVSFTFGYKFTLN